MWIRPEGDGSVLTVRVKPNARKDSIEGVREDHLLVCLNAPAVEGRANKALVEFLAKRLGIAKSRVSIRIGERGRTKAIFVSGLAPDEASRRLEL
ncbi:MAG: DUF167 domain-containing protein [Desulfomonilia bacterium]|jgi:uncharacterized protein (TIGR00251 family)